MIISDLFDDYLQRLAPSDAELEAARRHRDLVRDRIKLDGVTEFINSGSYIKRTAITPFKDIDLFVGFNPELYDRERKNVISRLAYHLNQSLPGKVRQQNHSVGVTFADMRVDVVPGFAVPRRDGYYRIRNRTADRWIETNIDLHKKFFQKRQSRDRRHRQLIQLVKAWKENRRLAIGSYLMELLITKCFDREGIPQGRDRALHDFFAWMATGGLSRPVVFSDFYARSDVELPTAPLVVLDPTNPRSNVARDLDARAVKELLSVADRSRARCGTAIRETARSRAAAIWGEILPDFPAA